MRASCTNWEQPTCIWYCCWVAVIVGALPTIAGDLTLSTRSRRSFNTVSVWFLIELVAMSARRPHSHSCDEHTVPFVRGSGMSVCNGPLPAHHKNPVLLLHLRLSYCTKGSIIALKALKYNTRVACKFPSRNLLFSSVPCILITCMSFWLLLATFLVN
jgi:hypothetical protein